MSPTAEPVEQQVKAFILAANEGWVGAARALDDQRLPIWFSGRALEDQRHQIAVGREHQFRIEYEKPEIVFHSIQAAARSAETTVITEEGWAYRMIEVSSDKCLFQVSRNRTRVTYRLRFSGGHWTIFASESEQLAERPARRPCES